MVFLLISVVSRSLFAASEKLKKIAVQKSVQLITLHLDIQFQPK